MSDIKMDAVQEARIAELEREVAWLKSRLAELSHQREGGTAGPAGAATTVESSSHLFLRAAGEHQVLIMSGDKCVWTFGPNGAYAGVGIVQWTDDTRAPRITQATPRNDATPAQDFMWQTQSAFPDATVHKDSGNAWVVTGSPASGGVAGSFIAAPGGGEMFRVGPSGVSVNRADLAGGEGVLALKSATTAPAASPVGGGVLYVDADGHLTYKGPRGTVSKIAAP